MKRRLSVILLGVLLITPSLYAQKFLRGFKSAKNVVRSLDQGAYKMIKTPPIHIPTPSVATRVTAAVRGQTPALKRLQNLRANQAYKGLVTEWRARNISLAEQLDVHGVIVTKLPNEGKMVDSFSADGLTWYAADDMLVKAVKDGRFVRVDETVDAVHFSLYKNGPELEFYDEQLFKELDRSRGLGMSIVSRNKYVTVQFPEEFLETELVFSDAGLKLKDIHLPYNISSYTHVSWMRGKNGEINSPLYAPEEVAENGLKISKKQGGTVESIITNGKSVQDLNNWYVSFQDLASKLKPYEGKLNIRIVYNSSAAPNKFMLQDSKGVLHETTELNAVIQAEQRLSLPAVRVETPKIELPENGGFEEVF